ncbi:alpha/beta hydrolase [bacterium]|nr:alpha/beta hydrolase [bacterium]
MVFFPIKYPQGYWNPQSFGLDIEDCYFVTADGLRLHGWLLKSDRPIATMLWCHGNAGNISDRLDNLAKLARLPINTFIFDYRGYGRSEGVPSEPGVYLDAKAAFDYLTGRSDIDRGKIVLFGRSLGGAVAVKLATERPSAGLILESAFTSAKDMAKSMFGFLPVHLITKSDFDSESRISSLRMPVLVLHGSRDRTVPYGLGRKLFEAANEPKHFYEIVDADHNDTYLVGGQPYFDELLRFIREVTQPETQ